MNLKVALPGEHVGAEHTADDVAQVRHVVNVWKSAGEQQVLFPSWGRLRNTHNHITEQAPADRLSWAVMRV